MASIAGLGKIGLPRLSENMDPEDARVLAELSVPDAGAIAVCALQSGHGEFLGGAAGQAFRQFGKGGDMSEKKKQEYTTGGLKHRQDVENALASAEYRPSQEVTVRGQRPEAVAGQPPRRLRERLSGPH